MFKIVVGIIITGFVITVCFWVFVISTVANTVQDNGGVKNSIVKVGKEVKDISNQINEENSSK